MQEAHVSSSTEGWFAVCGDAPGQGHGIVAGPFIGPDAKTAAGLAVGVHNRNYHGPREGNNPVTGIAYNN